MEPLVGFVAAVAVDAGDDVVVVVVVVVVAGVDVDEPMAGLVVDRVVVVAAAAAAAAAGAVDGAWGRHVASVSASSPEHWCKDCSDDATDSVSSFEWHLDHS